MLQWWGSGRSLRRDVPGARRWILPVLVSQVRDPGLQDRVAVCADGLEAISRPESLADTPGDEPCPIHPAVGRPPALSRCGAATEHPLWPRSGGGPPRRDNGGPVGLRRWWLSVAPRRPVPRVVDVAPAGRCLRCPLVGQTPIYDQLRGQRLHAEVAAKGADLQRLDHPGSHRRTGDLPVPAAVFGQPEADSCWRSQPAPAADSPGGSVSG